MPFLKKSPPTETDQMLSKMSINIEATNSVQNLNLNSSKSFTLDELRQSIDEISKSLENGSSTTPAVGLSDFVDTDIASCDTCMPLEPLCSHKFEMYLNAIFPKGFGSGVEGLTQTYLMKLKQLDESKAESTILPTLAIYQDWVVTLLSVHEKSLQNIESLETKVLSYVDLLKQRDMEITRREAQEKKEVKMLKNDIKALLQYIQRAHCTGNWSVKDLQLKSIKPSQVIGKKEEGASKDFKFSMK